MTTNKTVTARLYVDLDSIAKRVWQDDLVTIQGDCKNDFHILGIPFVEWRKVIMNFILKPKKIDGVGPSDNRPSSD